ncbi:unnamed protein product [Brassicogethes aeneus]|uniref:Bee-milk protein n=1 Tax=Brassicogethes aeneus TaxID=1431903 RepID=A0A9P0BJH6_BRAAE|nr:unnamed protein product [Brassicogethes aeneus]
MICKGLLFLTLAVFYANASCEKSVVEWTGGLFNWPSATTKNIYKNSGRYVSKNIVATRGQIFKDSAIVALPRLKPGVPVTLATIDLRKQCCEAVLRPFPCWANQEEGSCEALQNVVDLVVDANAILWVLDTGVVNTMTSNPIRLCPPKVVAYSLLTGKKVKTLDLSGLVVSASRLQYIAVEYAPDGRPFAYVSDAATRSILVFDIAGNKGYRIVLPKAVTGSKRDVLYLALTHKGCGNNFLIFTYLSGNRIYSIRTDYLRAGCAAGKIVDLGVKSKKIILLGTDNGKALFFRNEGESQVYRWDSDKPFVPSHFELVFQGNQCQLATQVMPDNARNKIRVMESNFPDFIQGTVGCGTSHKISVMGGTIDHKSK